MHKAGCWTPFLCTGGAPWELRATLQCNETIRRSLLLSAGPALPRASSPAATILLADSLLCSGACLWSPDRDYLKNKRGRQLQITRKLITILMVGKRGILAFRESRVPGLVLSPGVWLMSISKMHLQVHITPTVKRCPKFTDILSETPFNP